MNYKSSFQNQIATATFFRIIQQIKYRTSSERQNPHCVIDQYHDDVIKWKHFPRYWPFVRGIHRSPVNSPHKGQWRGAFMFSLICAWINDWVNTDVQSTMVRVMTWCCQAASHYLRQCWPRSKSTCVVARPQSVKCDNPLLKFRNVLSRSKNKHGYALLPPFHDDVIKWKHFPRYWPFVRGIPPTKASYAEFWCFFCFLSTPWINRWVNNREAGDLRRYRARYDGIVMIYHGIVQLTYSYPAAVIYSLRCKTSYLTKYR